MTYEYRSICTLIGLSKKMTRIYNKHNKWHVMNNLDYAKSWWCYAKDQQQTEATAMPRLEEQRKEMVLPEPKNRVICGGWHGGKPVLWAQEPWEALTTYHPRQKTGEGNHCLSLFLSTSTTPASDFHWRNSTWNYLNGKPENWACRSHLLWILSRTGEGLGMNLRANSPSTSFTTLDWFLCHWKAGVDSGWKDTVSGKQSIQHCCSCSVFR